TEKGNNDTRALIKLFNLEGNEMGTIQTSFPTSEISNISFSPDGKTLASVYEDRVILWNLNLDDLLGRACDTIRNYLLTSNDVSQQDKHLCDGIETTIDAIQSPPGSTAIPGDDLSMDQILQLQPDNGAMPGKIPKETVNCGSKKATHLECPPSEHKPRPRPIKITTNPNHVNPWSIETNE
ncbi:hypothetical protein, partial [Methylomonas fluvii]